MGGGGWGLGEEAVPSTSGKLPRQKAFFFCSGRDSVLVFPQCKGLWLNLLRARSVASSRLSVSGFPGEEKEGVERLRESVGVTGLLLILTFITQSVQRVLRTSRSH